MATEKVTIARISSFSKDKNGEILKTKQGKPYTRVLLDTTDGRKMSGFGNQTTSGWSEGMEVEVEVSESNGYLNFNVPKRGSVDTQALEFAIKTHIDQKFAALQEDLRKIAEHLGMDGVKPKTSEEPSYPEHEGEPKF